MTDWRPLQVREDPSQEDKYSALDKGMPEHLRWSLWEWIKPIMGSPAGAYWVVRPELLRKMERVLKISIRWDGDNKIAGFRQLQEWAHSDTRRLLDIADFLLSQAAGSINATALNDVLVEAGSAYHVVEGGSRHRLESRVDATTRTAFDAARSPGDEASSELAEAWNNAFGMAPDASDAWDHAIKAVEAVLIPIVVPGNPKATLGQVLAVLRDHPGDYVLELSGASLGGVETLEAMLRLMWPNPDRHGGGPTTRTPELTEAEAVVNLAVAIVQWVRAGVFRKA
jgi:hypothetical protein